MISATEPLWQEPPPSQGFWSGLAAFAGTPGVIEVALLLAAVLIVLLMGRRWRRLLRMVRSRRHLQSYLLGVEQAQSGDLDGALAHLRAVLAEDPENHYARLLLGKVLAERGEPALAHKEHLYLQRAFEVDSGQNDLCLAESLLLCGRAQEAVEAAERSVRAHPAHGAMHEFLFRARLATGNLPDAVQAGQRALASLSDRDRQQALRPMLAEATARLGQNLLRDGQREQARALLGRATALLPAASGASAQVRMLEYHLQGGGEGNDRAPVPIEGTAVAAAPPSRWHCGACGTPQPRRQLVCPVCGSRERAEVHEPDLFAPLTQPQFVYDAIEENQDHVRRLIAQLFDADDPAARAQAAAALRALGDRAVEELLAAAWQRGDGADAPAVDLLCELGPQAATALFAASKALAARRPLGIGGRVPTALLAKVLQSYGRAALPHVDAMFLAADPADRKVFIDYFLGLADPQAFDWVLERFAPMDVLHRCNKAAAAPLRRFLAALPPASYVTQALLRETTFAREAELLAACAEARDPAVLEEVLLQRGPTRTLARALLAGLAEEPLRAVSARVLLRFGERALDHLLSAFTDPDGEVAVRGEVGTLLAEIGPAAVDRLCASFGPAEGAMDQELRAVLVQIGEPAVPALMAAYGHAGWLERLAGRLLPRHNNRRNQIVRTLQQIGGAAALGALQQLAQAEPDQNLRLRLMQAARAVQEHRSGDDDGRLEQDEPDESKEGGSRGQVG